MTVPEPYPTGFIKSTIWRDQTYVVPGNLLLILRHNQLLKSKTFEREREGEMQYWSLNSNLPAPPETIN